LCPDEGLDVDVLELPPVGVAPAVVVVAGFAQ